MFGGELQIKKCVDDSRTLYLCRYDTINEKILQDWKREGKMRILIL